MGRHFVTLAMNLRVPKEQITKQANSSLYINVTEYCRHVQILLYDLRTCEDVNWNDLVDESLMTDFCAHSNEASGSVKKGNFSTKYHFLKEDLPY